MDIMGITVGSIKTSPTIAELKANVLDVKTHIADQTGASQEDTTYVLPADNKKDDPIEGASKCDWSA